MKTFRGFLSPMFATCSTQPILLDLISVIIFGQEIKFRISSYNFLYPSPASIFMGSDVLSALFSNTVVFGRVGDQDS
jgi:hypothetical protein